MAEKTPQEQAVIDAAKALLAIPEGHSKKDAYLKLDAAVDALPKPMTHEQSVAMGFLRSDGRPHRLLFGPPDCDAICYVMYAPPQDHVDVDLWRIGCQKTLAELLAAERQSAFNDGVQRCIDHCNEVGERWHTQGKIEGDSKLEYDGSVMLSTAANLSAYLAK